MTFQEILEKLSTLEETELIDLLGVTSDVIVEHFRDEIEDDIEKYEKYIEDNREDDLYEWFTIGIPISHSTVSLC